MGEHVSIMKVPRNSVALANHNIMVNAVKLIDVILINAKIMEPVLSPSLKTFQHKVANVLNLIMVKPVI